MTTKKHTFDTNAGCELRSTLAAAFRVCSPFTLRTGGGFAHRRDLGTLAPCRDFSHNFFSFADGRSNGRFVVGYYYSLLLLLFISELICLSKMCFDLKSLSCQTSRPEDE